MSIEDGFNSMGALDSLRRGMEYDTTTDCDDCDARIRREERQKVLQIIIEGEPTVLGRRVTLERIYEYVVND